MWLLEAADVFLKNCFKDTSFALLLSFPLFLPHPLLLPPVSFISAVRKLLTPLHTCKPERVKAFHKFFLYSKKNIQQLVRPDLKTHTHTHTHSHVKSSKSRQLWDLNLSFSPPLLTVWESMFLAASRGRKGEKNEEGREEELKSK